MKWIDLLTRISGGKPEYRLAPHHVALARAALLSGEEALTAWREWRRRVDPELHLDNGSFSMIPLLFQNLSRLGVRDPMLDRFKGVARRTWCQNQMLFHACVPVVEALESRGVPTLVLKGAPLAILYYGGLGLRPMADLDVLVPHSQKEEAIRILADLNWEPVKIPLENLTSSLLEIRHGWNFKKGAFPSIDLHWRLTSDYPANAADKHPWDAAISFQLQGIRTRTLSPGDLLFHVCLHGIVWHPAPPLRWIADALFILREKNAGIDWKRLIDQARLCQVSLKLHTALSWLRGNMNASIPANVLEELEKTPNSDVEKALFHFQIRPGAIIGLLPVDWLKYQKQAVESEQTRFLSRVKGFANYYRMKKNLKSSRDILQWAASRGLERIREARRRL
ncbi:MAG: nucleotidyltransferase family protein [Desulfobacterales bacterium]|nr:nucleotidyltransferase family protein [Desulfobacterales bacterium]